jgi:hypothetical protein
MRGPITCTIRSIGNSSRVSNKLYHIIERIVLLDFIHRLVSQKNWGIKYIYTKKSQYTRPKFTQGSITNHRATYPCVNFGRVYCDFLVYIFLIPQFFWDTRRWIKSKSTIPSIPTHHRQNPTEIIYHINNAWGETSKRRQIISLLLCSWEVLCSNLVLKTFNPDWTVSWLSWVPSVNTRRVQPNRCLHILTSQLTTHNYLF